MSSPDTGPGSFRLPHISHARVHDAMRPGVISCPADTPLRDVARVLATKHIHCLVVEREGGWGLISGLDLVRSSGGAFDDRTAGDIAASDPVLVGAQDTLEQAAKLMLENSTEHLIVTGADGAPAGILSTLDIAGVLAWGEA